MRLRVRYLISGYSVVLAMMVLMAYATPAYSVTPTVTSVTPDTGTIGVAQDVTITGTNFEPGARVSLLNGGPFLAGSYDTPGGANGVYVSGNYAYVADGYSGLQVIDISDPTFPTLAGSYDTYDANGVYVSGGYAYVADDQRGLQVIDITDPTAPTFAGSYNTPGYAVDVYVSGNYAYVADNQRGLQVIDITDPTAPTLAGSYNTPGTAEGVYVSGNYAYVADGYSGLQVIDISNPASPFLAGSYDTPGWAWGVYVSGDYAYVADYDSGLQVIDISNPTSPFLAGSYDTPGTAEGVYVSGNYAYVADWGSGLQVIDISNPTSPFLAGSYNTPGWAEGVYVSGNYAYVADDQRGIQVIDISDPFSPTRIAGSYDTPGTAYGVYASGSYAYVADGSSGLQVIDISDPTFPFLAGSYDTPGWAWGVYVSGDYAYLADYDSGLQVIDISNPATPSLAGSYNTSYAQDVYVSGSYAYVVSLYSGLQVIDISEPTAPILAGSYDTPGYAVDVYVSGNYAYVADDQRGIQVIDISDPTSPALAGSYNTPVAARGVYVSGSYAYVADGYSGLQVIDISNPHAPTLAGSYDTSSYARGVYVSGNYAYVADGSSGLQVIRINGPVTNIEAINSNTISATFPEGLSPGLYHVLVANPGREEGILHNGYMIMVTDTDTTPPLPINDLATGTATSTSVQLTWTAPGDDENIGRARRYDIRYFRLPITDNNWGYATLVIGEPIPSPTGSAESFTVTGLSSDTTYYFAIKTSDEVPNISGLSNVVSATTQDITPPAAVTDLVARTITETSVQLTWASPGDNGDIGRATDYDIRYSQSSITETNWPYITQVTGEPTPQVAGTVQSFIVTGLECNRRYYFAIKTSDEVPNISGLSNIQYAGTGACPPGVVPTVTSVTPDTGTIGVAQDVTITGTNFEPGAKVSLLNGGPFLAGSYDTPGYPQDVYVSGNYAYVADGDSGLLVIDITDPAAPSLAGSYDTPDYARGVYVSGNYAYVADEDSGLLVIDISDPTAPSLAGSYDTPDHARDVYVSGNYAYVADGDSGLLVIDITDPAAPSLAGSYDTPDHARDVYVSGNYAYVADEDSGLLVIDISDPTSPTLAGSYDTPDDANGVYVSGNYAYVADGYSGLQVIDISDPTFPTLAGSYDTPDDASSVYVSGDYAYVADEDSGLQVIDISNPTSPALAGSYDTGEALGVYVSDNYAYVVDTHSGLQVIDISDPTAPTLAGSYDTPDGANGVYVSGSYAYVADWFSGLQVIDISNPFSLSLAGSYDTPGYPQDVYVSGDYAYVADGGSGLQVIDINDPTTPTLAGSYDKYDAYGVYVSGRYAYVAALDSGLQVIDISEPTAPTLAGSYDTPGYARGVYVSGNYAYVAALGSGLQVIDISNPHAPSLAGSYDKYDAYGVYVSGRYAYVADWRSGLQVIDISNPFSLSLAGSYDTPDGANGVYVSGNYAYVADYYSGLQVIDISDPTAPILTGSYDTPGGALGVYVSGRYAYVADGESGLQVVRLNDPVTNIRVVDSTTITATFPAGLPLGPYHVLVTNPGGEEGILHNGFHVDVGGVSGISVNSIDSSGSISVDIFGGGFTSGVTVMLVRGDQVIDTLNTRVVSSGLISAEFNTSWASEPGEYSIVVILPDGTEFRYDDAITLPHALSETILTQEAGLTNVTVTGGFTSTLDFTDLEFVTITTGPFAGKGFSKGSFQTTLEGITYRGKWRGALFHRDQEGRIYLRGMVSGEIQATVEGYLTESVPESGIYDRYQAEWQISRLGNTTTSAIIRLDGRLSYQMTSEYPDTPLYLLQTTIDGDISGDYTGPVSTVLTHIRIAGEGNPYFGEGLSIISYTSESGSGEAWTYDRVLSSGIVELKGIFSDPLFGTLSATLDERIMPRSLSLRVERVDLGRPPQPDIKVRTWGPERVSPGQRVSYILEVRNQGVLSARGVYIQKKLSSNVKFIEASAGYNYDPGTHSVFWQIDEFPALSQKEFFVKVEVVWGLAQGTIIEDPVCAREKGELPNIFYSGINWHSETDLTRYLQIADSLDSKLVESYRGTGPLSGAMHVWLAYNNIGTDKNYIKRSEGAGKYKIAFSHSGGTQTLYKKIMSEYPETGTEVDYAVFAAPALLGQNELANLINSGKVKKVIIYQSPMDVLYQLKLGITPSFYEPYLDPQTGLFLCNRGGVLRTDNNECFLINITLLNRPKTPLENLLGLVLGIASDQTNLFINQSGLTLDNIYSFFSTNVFNKEGLWIGSAYRDIQSPFLNQDVDLDGEDDIIVIEPDLPIIPIEEPLPSIKIHEALLYGLVDDFVYGLYPFDGTFEGLKKIEIDCSEFNSTVTTAHDPNIKYGPDGDVSAGQRLDYRIEYENEGEGIAFGVYFTDTLDEDLDASTLEIGEVISTADGSVIGPAGNYDPETRTITWFVGKVGPGEGGYADLSINVRGDAPDGSEIINYGTVYFPSVPETTRTNGIVSVIPRTLRPPVVVLNDSYSGTVGSAITFDASGSYDPDGEIVSYEWDWDGNGVYDETAASPVITHRWDSEFMGVISLRITDNDGLIGTGIASVEIITPPTMQGDLDGDGDIDAADYQVFRSTLGKCTGATGFIPESDYDGDGCISYADYRIWYGYYRGQ